MGSGNVGQRARLETAEVCNRGQRRDLTAGACAAGDRERNGVWCCVQVTKREKPTQRLQDGETKMYRVPSGFCSHWFDSQHLETKIVNCKSSSFNQ